MQKNFIYVWEKTQWKKILSLLIYFYSLEPWIRLIDLLHFRLIHIFKNSPLEAKNVRIILKQEWTYFTFLIFLIILYKKKIYQKQWKELIQKKESRYISLDLLRIRTWVKWKKEGDRLRSKESISIELDYIWNKKLIFVN